MDIIVVDPNGNQREYNIEAFQKEVVSFGRQPAPGIKLVKAIRLQSRLEKERLVQMVLMASVPV